MGPFFITGLTPAKAETILLKFAHFMSPKHIQHQKSFEPFCKKVDELTGGNVQIKIYPGGALGAPKQLPDAVKKGITDIAFIIPSYTTGRFPYLSVLDLPFLCNSAVLTTQVIYDLYDTYFAKDFEDYKMLWLYSCGPGQLHSVTKPVHKAEDLKGMKMRTPGAYMTKSLSLLGANPVGMPISKLTVSLQKKVIDGMLTPWSAVKDFRLFDLVKYIAEVDMYTMPMAVVMNKDKWNSLPDSAKKAIDQAAGKQAGMHAAKVYDEHDLNTINENKQLKKIKVYRVPEADMEAFIGPTKELQAEWIETMSKKGIPAKELLGAVGATISQHK
jgi:TRAP-type C4-dicarboxylate transport system substrate-binding protein